MVVCYEFVQHMVVPVDRDGKGDDSTLLRRESTTSAAHEATSTRKAGGRPLNHGTQMVSCALELTWG